MAQGGYKIVDLKGVNITDNDTIVDGIYNLINNSQKAILFENVKITGTLIHDGFYTISKKTEGLWVTIGTDIELGDTLKVHTTCLYIKNDNTIIAVTYTHVVTE